MRSAFRVSVALLLSVCGVRGASAQDVLFSSGPGNLRTLNNATAGYGQRVRVEANTTITSFGFWIGTFARPITAKFYIFDVDTQQKVFEATKLLNIVNTPTLTLTTTDPFSLLLSAGKTYAFGYIGDGQFGTSIFTSGRFETQGPFSIADALTYYGPFSDPRPVELPQNGATVALEIWGVSQTVVPEPNAVGLLAGGIVLLGLAGRRRGVRLSRDSFVG